MHFKLTYAKREHLMFYLFLTPALLGLLIFTLGPMAASLYYSLCDYAIVNPPVWVGLDNYRRLFLIDPLPMHALMPLRVCRYACSRNYSSLSC